VRLNRFIHRFLAATISLWLIVVQGFAVAHPPAATAGPGNACYQNEKRVCSCTKEDVSADACARSSCCAVESSGNRPANPTSTASTPTSGAGHDLVQPPHQLALASVATPSATSTLYPSSSSPSPTVPLFARHCIWLI